MLWTQYILKDCMISIPSKMHSTANEFFSKIQLLATESKVTNVPSLNICDKASFYKIWKICLYFQLLLYSLSKAQKAKYFHFHLEKDLILKYVHQRYSADQIYTYVGEMLIAVNPFKELTIYSEGASLLYQDAQKESLPPHIFMVACSAYQAMIHKQRDQVRDIVCYLKTIFCIEISLKHFEEVGCNVYHNLTIMFFICSPRFRFSSVKN